MKRYLNIFILLLALLTAVACNQEKEHTHAEGTTYTCPMHPQVVQDGPGTCPVCHMDLVPQSVSSEAVELTDDLTFLLQPTNEAILSGVATLKPQQKTVQASVELEGIVTYDERRVYTIPAKVGGRIEKLLVQYNFQPVHKGQKLLEVYSPDLVTAQKELLYLVRSAPEDKALITASKQRLLLLGATEAQVNRLIRTGEASYSFAVYSPYDGYVVSLNTTAPSATPGRASATAATNAGGMGGGMGSSGAAPASSPAAASQDMPLREGMYVSTGQPLFRVVNPSTLWAEFNIPAGEVSAIAKGSSLLITFPQLPGERVEAKVDFLQPFYEAGENFAKVRAYLPGNQKLARVGTLVSAKATYATAPSLWIPREAVLDLGTQSVAFLKTQGIYKPVPVTLGAVEGDEVQVLDGLVITDIVASNAQFLVDSESFVKVNSDE